MSIFLTAEWRKLIMAQYIVQPEVLAPYMPRGVELDLFEGRCYVSLVGFLFDRVRVKGVAVPFHARFEEINLRFYVRRTEADGSVKRGVVFVREFVPRWAIAAIAKGIYEEPYLALPTRHEIRESAETLHVAYRWRFGGTWHSVAVEASPVPEQIVPRSEEEFITEHYWGYTKRSNGSASEYQVQHPRWQTYTVRNCAIDADMGLLYGPQFAFLHAAGPTSVLLAEGSVVCVYGGKRLGSQRQPLGR